jgi:hypothetical protein
MADGQDIVKADVCTRWEQMSKVEEMQFDLCRMNDVQLVVQVWVQGLKGVECRHPYHMHQPGTLS